MIGLNLIGLNCFVLITVVRSSTTAALRPRQLIFVFPSIPLSSELFSHRPFSNSPSVHPFGELFLADHLALHLHLAGEFSFLYRLINRLPPYIGMERENYLRYVSLADNSFLHSFIMQFVFCPMAWCSLFYGYKMFSLLFFHSPHFFQRC